VELLIMNERIKELAREAADGMLSYDAEGEFRLTEITDYPMNIKDLVIETNTNSLSLFDLKTNYNFVFHNGDRNVGILNFNGNGGAMVFEGDAEESAKVFFDALAEKFADRLKEEREKEREACAQLVDHILCEGGGTYGDAIRARGNE
jgi:hypothetical protein